VTSGGTDTNARIDWLYDAEQAKADALRRRRPILIDVFKVP
jgi:hypothetical protein